MNFPSNISLRKQKQRWLILAGILLLTFVCFFPTLGAEFINTWDDGIYITGNEQLKPLSLEAVYHIFTSTIGSNYNPLPIFTFAVEKQLFGLNPFYFHLNNILFHLLATAMVFYLMLAMRVRWQVVVIVTILFGIHPMRVESVAWITERKDVLLGVFYIAALIAYMHRLQALRRKNKAKASRYFWICLGLFVPALFSKIQAVSLPLSLLAFDFYFKRKLRFRLLWEKTPFFLLSLAFGLIGVFFLDESGALGSSNVFRLDERLLFAPYNLSAYLYKLFFPYPMATFYPYPNRIEGWLPTIYYITPFVILGITALTIWSLRYTRVWAFGLLFFFFNVVFVLQIVGAGAAFTADRFTYIPYLGLFIAVGLGVDYLLQKFPQYAAYIGGFTAVYLLLFSIYTYQHCKVWKNSETLWTYVIDHYPRAWQALSNRGDYYSKNKQIDKAFADFNQAMKANPGYADAYNNRGNLYFRQGKDQLALKDYNTALRIRPNRFRALGNRGAIYYRMGQYDKALKDLNKALELNQNYTEGYMNRGVVYSVLQNYPQAKSDYDNLIRLSPNHALGHFWRGIALQKMGQHQAALADFNFAAQRRPKMGAIYLNRSFSHRVLGDLSAALADAEKAKSLGERLEEGYLEGLK